MAASSSPPAANSLQSGLPLSPPFFLLQSFATHLPDLVSLQNATFAWSHLADLCLFPCSTLKVFNGMTTKIVPGASEEGKQQGTPTSLSEAKAV